MRWNLRLTPLFCMRSITRRRRGECQRCRQCFMRSLLTFALASLCALCSSHLALAETTPDDVLNRLDGSTTIEKLSTEEDVILAGDEWPDGVVEGSIKSKATPEGLVFAAKAGSKVALRVASPDPVGPALAVLKSILQAVYTRNQAIWGIEQDLAWRWYQHPEKRGKVPVVSKNDHLFAILDTPTFTNAGSAQKQYDTWYSYAQQFYPIPMGYKLASFDGGDWSPTGTFNIDDYEQYAKWYNYFEDVSESGGSTEISYQLPTLYYGSGESNNRRVAVYDTTDSSTYTYYNAGMTNNANNPLSANISISGVTDTINNFISEKISNGYKAYGIAGHWGYVSDTWTKYKEGQVRIYIVPSDTVITETRETETSRPSIIIPQGTKYYYISTVTSSNYLGTYMISGPTLYHPRGWNSPSEERTVTSDYNIANGAIFAYGLLGGNDNSVETEPVYFVPTSDTIKPIPPTITPDTATYITYNQISNTTTTVDLQPILDAIRNLDQNVQIGFDNVISSIETCCNNMREFLTAWLTDITNWYDLILTELQKQTRWLEAIYYSKANDVIVQPDDESDGGVDLQIQWENNLSQLEKKFPLSIPWDLYGCLALLDAPPQAPVFELPVVMTEYTVEVDLSDFEPVASISRKLSVLLFVVGLLMNTKKLISITIGEGMPD